MDVDSNNDKENTNNSNKNKNESESKKMVDIRYDVELTRAIKENHGDVIVDFALCPFEGGEAFLATVGSNQVKINIHYPLSLFALQSVIWIKQKTMQ